MVLPAKNFYAEFLAALEVESHADRYFGKIQVSPALNYDEIKLPRAMTFGELAYAMRNEKSNDDGFERARLYNPFFVRPVLIGRRKIAQDYIVRGPKNFAKYFFKHAESIDLSKVHVEPNTNLYKILPGDTLSTISRDFGISVRQMIEVNNLGPHAVLRPGQRLVIPTVENR